MASFGEEKDIKKELEVNNPNTDDTNDKDMETEMEETSKEEGFFTEEENKSSKYDENSVKEDTEDIDVEINEDEDSKINGLLDEMKFMNSQIRRLEDENKKFKNECEAYKDRLKNISSEYENYRNRTDREKDDIEDLSTVKVLKEIVPIIDNLERALITETDDLEGLKEGVNLTLEQFKVSLVKLGVEEIDTENGFNPELHEAVMHETDETKEKNIVGEVLLKGYRKDGKIIRHSVVKVIN